MQINIPKQQSGPGDHLLPVNARQTKRWLKELPLVNMGETTRQFYTGLGKINRGAYAAKTRLEIMETMRPTAVVVLSNLHKHLVSRTLPLPPKTRKILQLTLALLDEMAIGYKAVVDEAAYGDAKLDPKGITCAVHRAMRYIGEQIQLAAQVYSPDPEGAWHDLHQLYKFAEIQCLSTDYVRDDLYQERTEGNIADVYKQICLLALARPSSLRQGEAAKLYAYFETASSSCAISHVPLTDANDGIYFSHLASDSAPAYVSADGLAESAENRYLDIASLLQRLKDQIQSTNVDPSQSIISKSTLNDDLSRRVLSGLSTVTKRRFSRAAQDSEVRVALGLLNIHNAIKNESARYEYVPDPRAELNLELMPAEHTEPDDGYVIGPKEEITQADYIWDTVARGNLVSDTALKSRGQRPGLDDGRQGSEHWLTWKVVNSSAGGYCLLWSETATSRAHVGELLALREREGNEYYWRVGIIRWMQCHKERELYVGVQLLAPRTLLVAVHKTVRRDSRQPSEGLMLPGIKTINQPPTLLTQKGLFAHGDEVAVKMPDDEEHVITFTEICEQSGSFCQFLYVSTGADRKNRQKNLDEDSGFDSLWSEL
ncbi:MAG: hypothetical protein ACR2RB_00110 [Gammaproteobacteria bacterium]